MKWNEICDDNRAIDKLIATKVMGIEVEEAEPWGLIYYFKDDSGGGMSKVPRYSTDIAAAWAIVEKLKKTIVVKFIDEANRAKGYEVHIFTTPMDTTLACDKSVTKAICHVILKVENTVED